MAPVPKNKIGNLQCFCKEDNPEIPEITTRQLLPRREKAELPPTGPEISRSKITKQPVKEQRKETPLGLQDSVPCFPYI